jgi:ketosteroid isomerase-like protein
MRINLLTTLMSLLTGTLIAQKMGNKNLDVAKRAFAAWEVGENSGDYEAFKKLLAADFELFSHPLQPARGVFKGVQALAKMNELIASREKSPNNLRFSNITITQNENTFVFMFDSAGKVAGDFDYKGWNAIALTVKTGKIVGFREYFGDVEPNWFKAE